MKELSIEEKAKAYDEAKARMSIAYNSNRCTIGFMNEIFPELKESEDERTRKEIIDFATKVCNGFKSIPADNYDFNKWIAWLEKQGHNSNYIHITQTIIDYINRNKEKFENDIPKLGDIWKVKEVCTYSYVNNGKPVVEIENSKGAWMRLPLDVVNIIQGGSTILSDSSNIEKQGEQKPTDTEKGINGNNEEIPNSEQKPADKVEPKFKVGDRVIGVVSGMSYFITKVCDDHYNTESGCIIMFCAQDNFELYEQKPAWSKEDEKIVNDLLWIIEAYRKNSFNETHKYMADKSENWLKSLEDRVQPQQEWNEEDEPQKELAETYLTVFDKKFPILPTLRGKQLADYKNFLNKCQQIFGLKYWGLRPLQTKLFEKLSLLWASWGAEHLKGLGQTNGDTDNEKQEWSEEDEKMLNDTIQFIETGWTDNGKSHLIPWLKSLKDRVQPKPEWSEEDKEKMRSIFLGIEAYCPSIIYGNDKEEVLNWLKSLKDRYTWKPSEGQMDSITCAVRKMKESACYDSELVSLLNDLKKLK